MVQISFEHPIYLFFLLVIPLIIFLHFITLRSFRGKALKFANFDAIARIRGIEFFSKNVVVLSFTLIIMFLLIMALAGLIVEVELTASAHSFVLAIDNSQSMSANDFSPDRLGAAKIVASSFIDSVPFATRMGIVSFSGNTLVEEKVTDSRTNLKSALTSIQISSTGGTDLLDAVSTSANILINEDSKAIIIFSDGQINVGTVSDAIDYANENNIVVNTIAIGTADGGQTVYGLSQLDSDSLQALAFNTGGEYFEADNIDALKDSLNSAVESTRRKVDIGASPYLLIASIILFVLEYFLINTKYRMLP